jgi:choline monooxygenase
MTPPPPSIDPEIRKASTLPARFYRDPVIYQEQKERIFARSWQLVPGAERMKAGGHVLPFTLLEGCLDEPLLLANGDDGETRCLSNVCTHRGMLVVEGEGHARTLRCRYHGRRFGLDGAFLSMPEFEEVEGFPCPADDLPRLPLHRWGPLAFTCIDPGIGFHDWIGPVRERMDWLPLERFVFDAKTSHDYLIGANWALYCDNYLEEFHIPYVHQMTLGDALDYSTYRTELFAYANVQLGTGKQGDSLFDLPTDHPDAGTPMAAYYFWLFPNLMLNFYPWGLSVNLVTPLGPERTRVSFLSYVWRPELRAQGAGSELHRVEMEDEEVVEAVQKGVRSRLYDRGRYSPRRETGVHHFHGLLSDFMRQ